MATSGSRASLIGNSGNPVLVGTPGDGDANAGLNKLYTIAYNDLFNEVGWDRQRGNTTYTLLASAARTTQTSSTTQTNFNARGVLLVLNVTAASGTGGLTLKVFGIDPISGQVAPALLSASAAIIAVGTPGYIVYPGGAGGSNSINTTSSQPLPRIWVAQVNVGDASSYTYSLSASLIV